MNELPQNDTLQGLRFLDYGGMEFSYMVSHVPFRSWLSDDKELGKPLGSHGRIRGKTGHPDV